MVDPIAEKEEKELWEGNQIDKIIIGVDPGEKLKTTIVCGTRKFETDQSIFQILHQSTTSMFYSSHEITLQPSDVDQFKPVNPIIDFHIEQDRNENALEPIVCEWNKRDKHELDIKFPHTCFKCKKPLYWNELVEINASNIPAYKIIRGDRQRKIEWLEKLWKSDIIQFYCCKCYKKIEVSKKIEQIKEEGGFSFNGIP